MQSKTLYVGNLPYSATESQLTTLFSAYGATNARIVEGRGFGFVDVDSAQLEAAIADKHNSALDGRTITVNEARPRQPRSTSGGSSYGNSSGGGGGRPRSGSRW